MDYIKGWLSICWRLPKIMRTVKHISNVGEEDRESWGSVLEENAEKFPENAAVKSEEASLTYRAYNEGGGISGEPTGAFNCVQCHG
jgi:hypothetical protein